MTISVRQIAEMLGAHIDGDADVIITGPAKIEDGTPGTLTFLANDKYESFIYSSKSSAALVKHDFQPSQPLGLTLIRVDDVYAALQVLLAWYDAQQAEAPMPSTATTGSQVSIHPDAKVAEDAHIGPLCIIEAGAVIEEGCKLIGQVYIGRDAHIGAHTILHPGVRVMKQCIIGSHCQVYPNAVIGSDGFGYSYDEGYHKIPQIGIVRLGDRVEVGAGSTIDRAVMGETYVGDGTIIDNMVHIAHNVTIDSDTAIAAQTGVAGSSKIGKLCRIGGQVGIAGHIEIADDTHIQAKSGIMKSTKEGDRLFGYPAISYNEYLRSYAVFKKLPTLMDELRELRARVAKLHDADSVSEVN